MDSRSSRSPVFSVLLSAAILFGGLAAGSPAIAGADADAGNQEVSALAKSRIGLARGYVDDTSCGAAGCHAALIDSFRNTDKAGAFLPVMKARVIEDFENNHYYHPASQRHYEMTRHEGRLFFRRYQTDDLGEKINTVEQEVHWVQGAGAFVRAYFYQTAAGEIFQLPIAWYSRTGTWGMPPGYDLPAHYELQRPVRRECQFCHNAFPDLPEGADRFAMPQVFPRELPHGMGCQRCHGPGAEHTRLGLLQKRKAQGVTGHQVRASIVNPKNLTPSLHNDSCYQCHARPSSLMKGLVRFGRGDFSFRPGEPLADFLVQVYATTEGDPPPGQLGAISQPYRMELSRCFRESGGNITCTLCHDSHKRLSATEQAARFSAACRTCHKTGLCRQAEESGASQDCASCHMPKRLSNVSTMIITDHQIQRKPDLRIPQGPPRRDLPVFTGAAVRDVAGPAGELYRAAAVVQSGGGKDAVERLRRLIDQLRPAPVEPYMILAMGQLRTKEWSGAEKTLEIILLKSPAHIQVLEWLGMARYGLGKSDEAVGLLRQVVAADPGRAEAWFNLGLILFRTSRAKEAAAALERTVAVRPPMAQAWFYLGEVYGKLGRPADAELRYRRALETDPAHTRAYIALGRLLSSEGKRPEALRFLRHGARVAEKPAQVAEVLTALEGGASLQPH